MLRDDQVSPTTQAVGALLALGEELPWKEMDCSGLQRPFDDARNSKRRRLEKKVRKTEHLFSCKKNEQAKKKKNNNPPTAPPFLAPPGGSLVLAPVRLSRQTSWKEAKQAVCHLGH